MDIVKGIFGAQGITKNSLKKESRRTKFSDYLPWLYYHNDNQCYLNSDNTIGYAWEISTVPVLGSDTLPDLEQMLRNEYPKGSVLQFILHADENINPILKRYKENKIRVDELSTKGINEYSNFLERSNSGMEKTANIPLRNFRAFVFLKSQKDIANDLVDSVEQSLRSCNLNPRKLHVDSLSTWLRQFFNGIEEPYPVNPNTPIRTQLINRNTKLDFSNDVVTVGSKKLKVITPKATGDEIDPFVFNAMFGGGYGGRNDLTQINCPWIYSINIILDKTEKSITTKANITMTQRAGGSLATGLRKRLSEFAFAIDKLDDKEKFLKIIPTMVLYCEDEKKLINATNRVKTLWSKESKWVMQEETVLSRILMICTLPFGLYNIDKNVELIDREFVNTCEATARMLPIQSDYRGSQNPIIAFPSRRGQIIGVDVFDSPTSKNFLVSAESGAGKSFFLNKFCGDYYAANAKIRVTDIGGSYRKMALTNKGRYIDFSEERICLNPLDFKYNDEEDFQGGRDVAVTVVGEMAYSASGNLMDESEWSLLKIAIDQILENGDHERGIDAVYDWLIHIEKNMDTDQLTNRVKNLAKELAFNLRDFTSQGNFGAFFCGKNTFDINSDEFVIVELEKIRGRTELFSVLVMQVMNLITADLYLGDRDRQTFILFEEVASLLNKQGHKDLSRLGTIINEGYRRARKYHGSFGVVLQSLLDLLKFGDLGDVILENAAYKFLLQGKTYEKAAQEKIINYDGLALDLLKSVKNAKPNYSEMMIDSPYGRGVARFAVDNWTYWLNTSEGDQTAMFEHLLKSEGLTPYEAMSKLSGVR